MPIDLLPIHHVRIENLRALAKHNGGVNAFAEKLGYTNGSYISAMIGENPTRPVSERTARKYEEMLLLPAGWLDQDQSAGNPAAKTVIPAQAVDIDLSQTINSMKQTAQLLEESGLQIGTTAFVDLVELVMEDSRAHNQTAPRPEYVHKLIKLNLK